MSRGCIGLGCVSYASTKGEGRTREVKRVGAAFLNCSAGDAASLWPWLATTGPIRE